MIETAYTGKRAAEYDDKRFTTPQGKLFDTIERNELEKRLQAFGKTGNIAEIGCGTGRFLPLAAQYCDQVTGVDPSKDMLGIARKKVKDHPTAQLLEGEGAKIPLEDSSQDFVYSIRTLNQVESPEYGFRMIMDLFRICKAGGHILMEIQNKKSLNWSINKTRFTVNEVCNFVEKEKLGTVLDTSGILFFTQTALDKTPAFLIPLYRLFDNIFTKLFGKLCTRCYIHVKKA